MTRWIGRRKFINKLRKLPLAVRQHVKRELERAAADLVAAQKRNAPVKTGTLRDAIKWRWGSAKGKAGALREQFTVTIYIDDTADWYAHLAEFGRAPGDQGGMFKGTKHPGHQPQPYFYPTYRAKRRSIKSRIRRGVKKAVQSTQG